VRRRAWAAWALLALGIGLALLGRVLPGREAWELSGGLALLAALTLALGLLPFWSRALPALPPFPGLFRAPRAGERWCARCGGPTPRKGACRTCGHTPASRGK
jgi:hypothetical protein